MKRDKVPSVITQTRKGLVLPEGEIVHAQVCSFQHPLLTLSPAWLNDALPCAMVGLKIKPGISQAHILLGSTDWGGCKIGPEIYNIYKNLKRKLIKVLILI